MKPKRVALDIFWRWVYDEMYRDWSRIRDDGLLPDEAPLLDTEGTTWVSGADRGDVPRTRKDGDR